MGVTSHASYFLLAMQVSFPYGLLMDLKEAARRADLTGAEIARLLGVSEATVSRWLARKVVVPSKHIVDICLMLKVNANDILPPGQRL